MLQTNGARRFPEGSTLEKEIVSGTKNNIAQFWASRLPSLASILVATERIVSNRYQSLILQDTC